MSVTPPNGQAGRLARLSATRGRSGAALRLDRDSLQLVHLPHSALRADVHQVRHHTTPESLNDLKESIRAHGILEPLVARRGESGLELVCGHRRYAASKLAGLTQVPVLVRDIPPEDVALVALHENIHRDGMTPLEEARVYQAMLSSGRAKSQGQLAQLVGVTQGRISQMISLLGLPKEVQELLAGAGIAHARPLTEPHARVIRQLPDRDLQIRMAREAVESRWSVQALREQVEAALRKEPRPVPARRKARRSSWVHVEDSRYRRTPRGITIDVQGRSPQEILEKARSVLQHWEQSI